MVSRSSVAACAATLAFALAAPVHARPPAHSPVHADPIAAAIADPGRDADRRALDEGRKPAEIIAFAQVHPGDVVADWGAGGGYYSELFADVVGPKGMVYAVGTVENVDVAKWSPILARHPNIRPLFVSAGVQTLAPASLDLIFAHLEYHDLYWSSVKFHYPVRDVDAVLRNWYAALRPGGRVVVIDHVGPAGGDPRQIADKFHRIDPERVKADFARAGFVLDGESSTLHREEDPHNTLVFDPAIRGHTDRFVLRFVKRG